MFLVNFLPIVAIAVARLPAAAYNLCCNDAMSRVTLYTAGHLHTAVPHCSHGRAPIVHTAVPWENNEHGCVYLRCRAVCKLPGCVEGHPCMWILELFSRTDFSVPSSDTVHHRTAF